MALRRRLLDPHHGQPYDVPMREVALAYTCRRRRLSSWDIVTDRVLPVDRDAEVTA